MNGAIELAAVVSGIWGSKFLLCFPFPRDVPEDKWQQDNVKWRDKLLALSPPTTEDPE